MPKKRPGRSQTQDIRQRHLRFVPLKNKSPFRTEHAETLRKALAQVSTPVLAEPAVFRSQPAFFPGPDKMRRIKNNKRKRIVGIRQGAEVKMGIRPDTQNTHAVSIKRLIIRLI